ncbi:MAG TPA: YlxR family protein [Chloroflexota bacterium]|nr:YlxR family protein [Chloroflexota bacterium]
MAPPARGSRPRHVPQRTCVVCRQTSAKRQLVRIVRTPDGSVRLDPTGKLSGRGAYLCVSPACWQSDARKARGALARGLKVDIITEDDLLFETLNAYAQRLSGTSEPVASSPRND